MRIENEPSTRPADYDFRHRVRVRFAETDAMGIVHHSRYLPMLEETRVEFLRSIGHPYDQIRAEGGDMPVLEAWLRYRSPLYFDDRVDIDLSLWQISRTAFQMAYLLSVDGEARATAVTAHGCLNLDGKPTRLPDWLTAMSDRVRGPG